MRRRTRAQGNHRLPVIPLGIATTIMAAVVLLPIAAIGVTASHGGWAGFKEALQDPTTRSALRLTVGMALAAAAVNAIAGTMVAWTLVRDQFPAKRIVDIAIDLPFAVPTVVAGLVLASLYGPKSPVHLNLAYTRWGIFVALVFVTLPFSVRTVEAALLELDRDAEAAAACLGAKGHVIFRKVVLPNLFPAIVSGATLTFAKALGEFGSIVIISGNIPGKTQLASVRIFGFIESGAPEQAAALSIVLLVIALVTIALLRLTQRWFAGRQVEEESLA